VSTMKYVYHNPGMFTRRLTTSLEEHGMRRCQDVHRERFVTPTWRFSCPGA